MKTHTLAGCLLVASLLLNSCSGGSSSPAEPFTVANVNVGADTHNVLVEPFLSVYFSSAVNEQSAQSNITLKDAQGQLVPLRIVTSGSGYSVGVFTVSPLAFEQTYTLTVGAVRSINGATLASASSTTFTTEKRPYNFKVTLISANSFSPAQLTTVIQNTSSEAVGQIWFAASCQEDGYPNLSTSLEAGRSGFAQGEAADVYFNYKSGFNYFTGNTVRCTFSAEDRLTHRRVTITTK